MRIFSNSKNLLEFQKFIVCRFQIWWKGIGFDEVDLICKKKTGSGKWHDGSNVKGTVEWQRSSNGSLGQNLSEMTFIAKQIVAQIKQSSRKLVRPLNQTVNLRLHLIF